MRCIYTRTTATYIHCNDRRIYTATTELPRRKYTATTCVYILPLQAAAGASTNRSTPGLSPRAAAFEPKDEEEAKVYEELKELFQFYDTDGSGELGVAEVRALFVYFFSIFWKKEYKKGDGSGELGVAEVRTGFLYIFLKKIGGRRRIDYCLFLYFCCFIAFFGARFVSQG